MAAKQSRDVAIQPVRQSRIYTEIVDQVLGLIKSGNVGVGDRLPSERHLAQQLNVSRSALREAMTALEVLGIVEIKPGVGIFIGPDQHPADDATVVKQVSDLLTEGRSDCDFGGACAVRAGPCQARGHAAHLFDLAAMDDTVRQMELELQRGNEGWEPDWGFHKALSAATRNPFAELVLDTLGQRMQNQLWRRMRAHNFELLHRGQRYAQDHRSILEAVRQGDGDAAFRAMHTHIRTIQADLEADHTLLQVNIAETK